MSRTSLLPAVFRMLTLSTVPLITYFGVTQYNELNKVELPELTVEEIEPETVVKPSEPQKKIRKVWKQTLQGRIDLIYKSDKLLEEPYKRIASNFENASHLTKF